jgi:IS30 family transposase
VWRTRSPLDAGTSLVSHRRLSAQIERKRGSNENTNRLLRFWFEKSSDLSGYTKADLKRIADKLNTRPRPTLDLDTPAQRLAALISHAA